MNKNNKNKNLDEKNINEKEIEKVAGGLHIDPKIYNNYNKQNLLLAYGGPKLIAPNLTTEKFKLKKQENNKNINTNFSSYTENKE
ncbi:MAG: hypothetical protein J6P21_01755 [Clostridia bacterium]|nr:hypothetical protein [Clostridia bacterium]